MLRQVSLGILFRSFFASFFRLLFSYVLEGKKGAQEEPFGGILGVKIGTRTDRRDVFFENVIFHGMSIKQMVFEGFSKAKVHKIRSKIVPRGS